MQRSITLPPSTRGSEQGGGAVPLVRHDPAVPRPDRQSRLGGAAPIGQAPGPGIHQRLHALIHRLGIEPALAENPAISRLSWGVLGWQREMRQNDVDPAET